MLARCARCQGTFTTDRYGRQTCPHCGSELILPAPAGAPPPEEPPQPPSQQPAPAAAPSPQQPASVSPPPEEPPQPPSQEPAPAAAPSPQQAASVSPPPAGPELPPPPGPPPGGYGPGGWGPPPPPPGGGWGPYPPPPGPVPGGPEAPSPFAERKRLGFFAAFFETWKLVATQPQQFFSRVRLDQTGSAILFGVIAATVGNVASAVYAYFSGQQAIVAMQEFIGRLPEEQARFVRAYMEAMSGGSTLAQIVLAPLLTVIFIYLGAAVLHLLLKLFRGANRGFDATLTTVAYGHGLLLLLAVPGCGGLLAFAWGMVVAIIGLGAAHRCGTGRAAAAVLAPAAILLVCCCGAFGTMILPLLKGAQEAARDSQNVNL